MTPVSTGLPPGEVHAGVISACAGGNLGDQRVEDDPHRPPGGPIAGVPIG